MECQTISASAINSNGCKTLFTEMISCLGHALSPFSAALNDPEIADNVVERLLTILTQQEMYQSPYAGHLLQFFEIESECLTDRQKWFCIRFLNAHGNEFTDGYSAQMIGELRVGLFLRMKKPNPQQWDDYQKMQLDAD